MKLQANDLCLEVEVRSGMDVSEAQEAMQLRDESARIKKLVPELGLDRSACSHSIMRKIEYPAAVYWRSGELARLQCLCETLFLLRRAGEAQDQADGDSDKVKRIENIFPAHRDVAIGPEDQRGLIMGQARPVIGNRGLSKNITAQMHRSSV